MAFLRSTSRGLTALFFTLLVVTALCLNPTLTNATEERSSQQYNIAATSLESALNQFGREAGILLAFDPALVQGLSAPALNGEYDILEGLRLLLNGSDLEVVDSDNGSYRVQKPEANTTMLPPVKVSANVASEHPPLSFLKNQNTSGALGNKRILDTPFSITMVDSDDIQKRGAKSIGQIFINDASIYTPTSSFTTDWWGTKIRGLDTRKHYIDGVPMMLHWGGDFPIETVEKVVALKGLAGFMYGFGSPGGAISYQLKRPTDVSQTTLNLGFRNPSQLTAHVDTSQNFGEDWGVRLNLATDQGTTYNDSETDRVLASVAIDKDFGESLSWFTTLLYEDNTTEAQPLQFYMSDYDVAASGGNLPKVTYDYDDFNIDNSYYKTKTQLASTGFDWDINKHWNLRYQIGFSRKHQESNRSFAYLLNRDGDYEGNHYNFAFETDNLFSQLMAQGHFTTGSIAHQQVTGLELQEERTKGANEYYWSNDFNGNIYQNQNYRFTRTPDFSLQNSNDVKQSSIFISDTLTFSEHWDAIFGLRGTDYKMKDSGYDTTEVSPTLALIFKPDNQTSLYGSYVESLEPGTEVDDTFNNAGEVLGATVSEQYELGIKHATGTLNYAAALFRIERANQIKLRKQGNTLPDLTQDGMSIYDGLELSAAYQFTGNLYTGASLIHLDAEIDKTDNATIKGHSPEGISDLQTVLFAQYQVPGINGLQLHGNVRYYGDSYTSSENDMEMPGWTTVNAGFSYVLDMANQNMVLNGNIYNLLNEKYWAAGGNQTNTGEERNFVLTLSINF